MNKITRIFLILIFSLYLIPTFTLAQSVDNNGLEQFKFAKGLFDKGMLKEAKEESQKFVDYYKSSKFYDKGLFLHSEILYRLGEYKKSVKYFNEFITKYPDSELVTDAYYSMAWSYYNLKKLDDSYNYFSKLKDSNDFEIKIDSLFRMAQIDIKRKKLKNAEKILEKLIKMKGNDSLLGDAAYTLSKVEIAQGKKDEALRSLKTLIRRFPDYEMIDDAYFDLGELNYLKRKFKIAIINYEKGLKKVKKDSKKVKYYYSIGFSYFEIKKYKKAEKYFEKVVSTGKSSQYYNDSLLQLGKSKFQLKKYKKAIDILKKVSDKNSIEAKFYMAYSYFKLKKYDKSRKIFREISSNKKTEFSLLSLFYRGVVLFEERNYKKSIEIFNNYLQYNPKEKYNLAKFNISQCYFNLGKYRKAEKLLRELRTSTKDISLIENIIFSLTEILMIERKSDEAIKILSSLPEKSRRRGEALVRIGDILVSENKDKEALKYYSEASNGGPNSFRAAVKAGKILLKLGKIDEAADKFKLVKSSSRLLWREAQYRLGKIEKRRGNLEKAEKIFNRLSNSGVSYNLESKNLLAEIKIKKGEYDEAEKLLDSIISEGKNNPVIVGASINLSNLRSIEKKYDEALKFLEQAQSYARSKEKQAEIEMLLGTIYEKLKKNDRAIRAYLKVEILYSQTSYYPQTMIKLAKLYLKTNRKRDCKKLLKELKKKVGPKYMDEIKELLKKVK